MHPYTNSPQGRARKMKCVCGQDDCFGRGCSRSAGATAGTAVAAAGGLLVVLAAGTRVHLYNNQNVQ